MTHIQLWFDVSTMWVWERSRWVRYPNRFKFLRLCHATTKQHECSPSMGGSLVPAHVKEMDCVAGGSGVCQHSPLGNIPLLYVSNKCNQTLIFWWNVYCGGPDKAGSPVVKLEL